MPAATPTPNPSAPRPPSSPPSLPSAPSPALFLAWLVYFHAPTDAAGTQLSFLPARQRAPQRASAPSRCSSASTTSATAASPHHRNSMFAAFIFSSALPRLLHRQPRPPRRHPLPTASAPGGPSTGAPRLAHPPLRHRAPDDPDHLLSLAHRPLPRAQAPRPLDLPHLALRLRQRSLRLLHASRHPSMTTWHKWMQRDTRQLLRTGIYIFGTGVLSVVLITHRLRRHRPPGPPHQRRLAGPDRRHGLPPHRHPHPAPGHRQNHRRPPTLAQPGQHTN